MTTNRDSPNVQNHATLIWGIAELLRGDYKQADYGKVILPLVVMRRLDQTLEGTKAEVLAKAVELDERGVQNQGPVLVRIAGQQFYNRSPLTFPQLLDDPSNVALNLRAYIDGYSSLARQVVEKFDFDRQIDKLERSDLLYSCLARVCEVDLHPNRISNLEMGYTFEELIRRFSEQSNETAGEHFTPREVVRLMGNLLLEGDEQALRDPGVIRTVFDCACGTGGMLSEVEGHIRSLNPDATVHLYGQELNEESYAICLADMLVKGQDARNIVFGNSLSQDGHSGESFHYGLANPPFGVDWQKVDREVRAEHEQLGADGRFGPGLPRKGDGQLLFLLHLLSKMRDPAEGGGRVAIVQSPSALTAGGAGRGESEIRRWIVENDLLEAVIALPEKLFYNTEIATYVWLLTNRKIQPRAGKVQLIDGRDLFTRMRKPLGKKRHAMTELHISELVQLHHSFKEGPRVKILDNEMLGYREISVAFPLRGTWRVPSQSWHDISDLDITSRESDQTTSLVRALCDLPTFETQVQSEVFAAIKDAAKIAGCRLTNTKVQLIANKAFDRDPSGPVAERIPNEPLEDPGLREKDIIGMTRDAAEYLAADIRPFAPDAWILDAEGRVGFEVPFTRLFHRYEPPPSSEALGAGLIEAEHALTTKFRAFFN